jgi:hypothetical protein
VSLKRLLTVFRKNERITVVTEYGEELFRGPIWWLNDNKYLLSCLVVDIYRNNYMLTIVITQ